jgi:hypothetical protein
MTFLEATRVFISQELDLYGADEEEIDRLVNICRDVTAEIIRYHIGVELACDCGDDGCSSQTSHKADQYNFKYLLVSGMQDGWTLIKKEVK